MQQLPLCSCRCNICLNPGLEQQGFREILALMFYAGRMNFIFTTCPRSSLPILKDVDAFVNWYVKPVGNAEIWHLICPLCFLHKILILSQTGNFHSFSILEKMYIANDVYSLSPNKTCGSIDTVTFRWKLCVLVLFAMAEDSSAVHLIFSLQMSATQTSFKKGLKFYSPE